MSDYRTLDICSVADSQDLFIVEFGSYGSLLTFGLVTVTTAAEGLVVMSPGRQCYSLRIQPDCLGVGSDLSWDESTCGCPTGDNTSCDGLLAAVWAPGGNLPLATTTYCSLQVLTLASNERVALTPSMRLLFETHHLRTATPATVSRAGILYVNPQDLGWNPWAFLPFLTFFFFKCVWRELYCITIKLGNVERQRVYWHCCPRHRRCRHHPKNFPRLPGWKLCLPSGNSDPSLPWAPCLPLRLLWTVLCIRAHKHKLLFKVQFQLPSDNLGIARSNANTAFHL